MACICFPEDAPAPRNGERYNFAAGPAMLPPTVLAQIQDELPDWQGSGLSLLEQPFTGAPFKGLMHEAEQDLRTLLAIPPNYRVLFIHCRGPGDAFRAIAPLEQWRLDPQAGYCHVTSNETANGLQLQHFPELSVPLVADMSSDFLTRPLPVERFGLIYASAQKNLGIAGLCLLIVHDDLLEAPRPGLPSPFSYALQAEQQSRLCTPPTFALYCAALMLRWIAQQGGLAVMADANRHKSQLLYQHIDASDLYHCRQRPADRSAINVCFHLRDPRLLPEFLRKAAAASLLNLQGHAAIGGVRVSLYNAMPLAGVERLLAFMRDFERQHG